MRIPAATVIALMCVAIAAHAEIRQGELELVVGNQVYQITLDEAVTITTPGGEQVGVVVRQRPTLSFAGRGVSFDYPSSMTVDPGDVSSSTIFIESERSPLAVVQTFDKDAGIQYVRGVLLDAYRDEMKGRGAEVRSSGDTVKRSIGGVEREGTSIDFELGGESIQIVIYAYERDHDIIALVLQHDLAEGVLATRYFDTIAESLR